MELRQLKSFTTVARVGSFTKAAEMLDYAQSSVTTQVQSLEEELGTRLFERLGRKVALTREGEKLLSYADRILKLSSEAREMVSGSVIPRGTISIGAPESLCVYRLPRLLQNYREMYPAVDIVLKIGTCANFISWLRLNEIDVAVFLDSEMNIQDLIMKTLIDEPMVLLSGPGHHLIRKGKVGPQDMRGEYLILTEKGCSYRAVFEAMLHEEGVQPASILEFGSVEAIKKCVISGLGATLLPRVAVQEELAGGQLVDLRWSGQDFKMLTQISYHKDKWISPALRALLDLAEKLIK